MSNRLESRTQVFGIDFSGAKDAGKKIWIASGIVEGARLRIDMCQQARDLPGSGKDLARALKALQEFVAARRDGVFGFDFPFGLPDSLVSGKESWEHFIRPFPDDYANADAFRSRCRQGGGGHELKRRTDIETKTPFSPYNLRLYRQTYYGIRKLLYPLVRDQRASILPMQAASPDRPWVIEVCPASTLKREGINHTHYKRRGPQAREVRREILRRIKEQGGLYISQDNTETRILEDAGGDALDSVIAAFAAFRALRGGDIPSAPSDQPYVLEGYVYV